MDFILEVNFGVLLEYAQQSDWFMHTTKRGSPTVELLMHALQRNLYSVYTLGPGTVS